MAMVHAALQAADPAICVARQVHLADRFLIVGERPFDLARYGRIRIFGAGKASEAMTAALVGLLGERVTDGIVIAKHPSRERIGPVRIVAGDHPEPGRRSLEATHALLAALAEGKPDDLVLAPISGGASALLCAPAQLDRGDLGVLTAAMSAAGADIETLNAARKVLDRVKAGGLAAAARPAMVVGLLLSDVPGDQPATIGSGPTVPHESATTWMAGRAAISNALRNQTEVAARLHEAMVEPPSLTLDEVHNVVVGGNADAAMAAALAASDHGFAGSTMSSPLVGEATEAGRGLARLLAGAPEGWPLPPPACLVAGGETTVKLGDGPVGKGGRSLELALAAIALLAGHPDRVLVALATDGDDGNSGAAGAVVTGETASRAAELGLDLDAHAKRHDAATAFEQLGDLLHTGPTGTNVCDLAFLVCG